MGELAEASGVPAPTIKHYLREGLLPEPVKTSRNMAYYPPEFVDRIKLIKQLQEERFMPLKAIKSVLDEDPERARALVELEDRILDRALAGERTRTSAAEVRERYGVPKEVLDRLEELEVLSPNSRGYSPSDVKIIEAISRFRAGGYDEQIGFTVYDTLRYKSALEELVREEVDVVMDRLAGEVSPERVVEMLEAGAQPLQDLIAALHTKLMVAELERHRASRVARALRRALGRAARARSRCPSAGSSPGLPRDASASSKASSPPVRSGGRSGPGQRQQRDRVAPEHLRSRATRAAASATSSASSTRPTRARAGPAAAARQPSISPPLPIASR